MFSYPETADIETSSEEYAKRFSGAVGSWFLQVQETATIRMVSPYPRASILDVGGGHAQIAEPLVRRGYQVTVLGSAEVCSTRIRTLIDKNQCSFKVGNILDLPFSNQAFDIVISYRLLPHVNQWEIYLAELCRVARQAVVIDFPTTNSVNLIAPFLFNLKKHIEGNTRHYRSFKETTLSAFFEQHGFYLADRFPEFVLPMVLHRKMNIIPLSAAVETILRTLGITSKIGSPVIIKFARKNS